MRLNMQNWMSLGPISRILGHRLLRMESTWFVFVSLLLAANLLATVLTEGAPTPTTRTVVTQEPITIPFVKNRLCTLNQNGQSKQCGMRELNPLKGNGVIFWKPNICQFYKCQCMATKEVRREKRTIANNKTMIEQRRYRIFECV